MKQSLSPSSNKPVLPSRSPSTSSPYRTPIAATTFYGSMPDGPTKKHKGATSLKVSESLENISADDSHDEIDFLSRPKNLHERMRPKTGSVTTTHPVPYQPMAVSMKIFAVMVNEDYCYKKEDFELVSFPSHMLLLLQGVERSKVAWRDVQGCKVGTKKYVMLALDVARESSSGRSVAAFCAAQLEKVHLFLFLESNEAWSMCQQHLRSAVQVQEMTDDEGLILWRLLESKFPDSMAQTQSSFPKRIDPTKKPTPIMVGERRRLQQEKANENVSNSQEGDTTSVESTRHYTRARTRSEAKSLTACDTEPILRYPSSGPFAVTLLQTDLDRLRENEYLNDTLIEFGLRFLQEQIKARNPTLAQQIYVFNTFFYQKLTEYRDRSKSYEQVRKWTNRVNM